jgi:hypothetical protein
VNTATGVIFTTIQFVSGKPFQLIEHKCKLQRK